MSDKLLVSRSKLIKLIEDSITLDHLRGGGVENWEWYYDSLPEDDVSEKEILKAIKYLQE